MRYLYRVLYKKFVIFQRYGRFITNITCTGYKKFVIFQRYSRFITNIIIYTETSLNHANTLLRYDNDYWVLHTAATYSLSLCSRHCRSCSAGHYLTHEHIFSLTNSFTVCIRAVACSSLRLCCARLSGWHCLATRRYATSIVSRSSGAGGGDSSKTSHAVASVMAVRASLLGLLGWPPRRP